MIIDRRVEADGHIAYLFDNGGIHIERDNATHTWIPADEAQSLKRLLFDTDN
jgi:hypothetical protein